MTAATALAIALLTQQPTQQIEYHLYLGDNDESAVVRRAFEISSDEPARTMDPAIWESITAQHEALRAEIAEYAEVTIHEDDRGRLRHTPSYALSQYEDPEPFGRIMSQYSGREIKAYHNTWGVLKHIRYVVLLAHHQKQYRRLDSVLESQYLSVGNRYESGYGLSVFIRGSNPALKVYPPPSQAITLKMDIATPFVGIKVEAPLDYQERLARERRLLHYMDMGTGLIVGGSE